MSNFCYMSIMPIRTRNELQTAYNHNYRVVTPANVDPEQSKNNEEYIPINAEDYVDAVKKKGEALPYYQSHDFRKNGVMAYEILFSYSPDAAGTFDLEAWKKENEKWLKEEFDRNADKYGSNIVSLVYHYDEASFTAGGAIHGHAVVLPVDDRGKFCADYYTGNNLRMHELQDSYAKHMEQFGLKRGLRYEAAPHEAIRKRYARTMGILEKDIPEREPGEDAHHYEKRLIDLITTERAVHQKDLDDKDKEIREVKSQYRSDAAKDRLIKAQQVDLYRYGQERRELVHEFGGLHVMTEQARKMNDIEYALDNYPNREYAEAMENELQQLGDWAREEKKKRDKGEVAAEQRTDTEER